MAQDAVSQGGPSPTSRSSAVRREAPLPLLRRGNRRWRCSAWAGWLLLAGLGVSLFPEGAWGGLLVALAGLAFLLTLTEPLWVQVGPSGVRWRYLWGEKRFAWGAIQGVEGEWVHTHEGPVALPSSIEEHSVLLRLIAAVISGQPLLPPSARLRPSLETLEQWFHRQRRGASVVLRCGLWSPKERRVLTGGLMASLFCFLLFALTNFPALLILTMELLGSTFFLAFLTLMPRWHLPYRIAVDPEGIRLDYFFHRRHVA